MSNVMNSPLDSQAQSESDEAVFASLIAQESNSEDNCCLVVCRVAAASHL